MQCEALRLPGEGEVFPCRGVRGDGVPLVCEALHKSIRSYPANHVVQ